MDREAWCAVVHGVTKSQTLLSDWTELNSLWSPLLLQKPGILDEYLTLSPPQGIVKSLSFLPSILYWAGERNYGELGEWHPTPVLLPGKCHGQRSLVGCSQWGGEESDTTERFHFHFSLSCIGEGNGNPLQCSCLENPRDGRAWWAAIYGVAQSQIRLKWLSG